jgi:hypothetical protein
MTAIGVGAGAAALGVSRLVTLVRNLNFGQAFFRLQSSPNVGQEANLGAIGGNPENARCPR